MYIVHFVENKHIILSQYRKNKPILNEEIRIKGRKGKIKNIQEQENRIVYVEVEFEKKKKRR
ncbi:hypothetical protein [Fervidibacillus halotolerans]|uniref:Uncharacterized protein n=1 Tax=Fervidibacillus halotolerans TaxID=2980027 RepID=A0A9E8M215_9BACI|nr:hypothetical protein [Fervidibacillus halotolerans]WAA12834.1 hypothetical protein OE105_01430 [Fervidibacillus halotolerans]